MRAKLWVIGSLLIVWGSPVQAVPTLEIVPATIDVSPGDLIDVSIVISGLFPAEPVGAYDLDVSFDPALLTPESVDFGFFLGNPAAAQVLTDVKFPSAGVVDFAAVSLLAASALDALQPGSFPLATLSLRAIASGTSALTLSQVTVDDAFGNLLIGTKVPEPSSFFSLAAGLAVLMGLARRMRRKDRRGM